MKKLEWWLLGGAIALILAALVAASAPRDGSEKFSAADGQAEKAIGELAPAYKPWAKPVWQPPSGEVESLLFALQAALGAGFIGYFLGKKSALKQRESKR
jgi:cobalt/nickel transport protein